MRAPDLDPRLWPEGREAWWEKGLYLLSSLFLAAGLAVLGLFYGELL